MKPPYAGEERRKGALLDILNKRVLTLELAAHQQEEVLELAVSHLTTEQRKLTKDFTTLKDICRGCAGFGGNDDAQPFENNQDNPGAKP